MSARQAACIHGNQCYLITNVVMYYVFQLDVEFIVLTKLYTGNEYGVIS